MNESYFYFNCIVFMVVVVASFAAFVIISEMVESIIDKIKLIIFKPKPLKRYPGQGSNCFEIFRTPMKKKVYSLEQTDSPFSKMLKGKKPVHRPEHKFKDEELVPISKGDASWLLRFSIALAQKLGWIPKNENSEGP